MFNSLVENFLFNSAQMARRPKTHITQIGGEQNFDTFGNNFMFFFISLSVFFIKVLLVMISYNVVVPRILESWSMDMRRFHPITFFESIFLVILFNNLFSRF